MNKTTIKGNLITLALSGEFDLIAHGCNCQNTMGAGIARTIAQEFPQALAADKKTQRGDPKKLGSLSYCTAPNNQGKPFYIANLYTQWHWGNPTKTGVDSKQSRESCIEAAFQSLAALITQLPELPASSNNLSKQPFRIGIPLIGAGLAGGNWDTILPKIEAALKKSEGTLTVVEFDPTA